MPQNYSSRDMLEKLVSFPTISRDSNLELIDFVEAYLDDHGIASRRVYNAEGNKASLYAQVGPDVAGGVVLSGHTDVVPVDGQAWSSDPFALTEKDGKLFGRGACDMKGFLATCLALVPDMKTAGLKRPVQLALSYDEEVGCLGVDDLVTEMRKDLPAAKAVIVGEPTEMKVVSSHKGMLGMMTHVRGYEIHSSLVHQGVSAIFNAAKLVNWLEARMNDNRMESDAAGAAYHGAAYFPPYTTLHVGVLNGGTAHNITAKDCSFSTDCRFIPSEGAEKWISEYRAYAADVERDMQKIHPDAGIDIEVRVRNPGCREEPSGTANAEELARLLTGDNERRTVSYGTEAGNFQAQDYSVCVCGPGNIEQAHQPDEFIEITQLQAGEAFVHRLIRHLCE